MLLVPYKRKYYALLCSGGNMPPAVITGTSHACHENCDGKVDQKDSGNEAGTQSSAEA